ncbi:hypothetical protein [Agromyces italicus]|nr:hypothetical protein [Agromyces italicus]
MGRVGRAASRGRRGHALYAKLGYAEGAPFNDGPYADHWFSKDLTAR